MNQEASASLTKSSFFGLKSIDFYLVRTVACVKFLLHLFCHNIVKAQALDTFGPLIYSD